MKMIFKLILLSIFKTKVEVNKFTFSPSEQISYVKGEELRGKTMSQKSQYRTKQMMELQNYFKSIQGQHVTVNEVENYFRQRGISIGKTTIYRQLERMVSEGIVEKYSVNGIESACFEYIGEPEEKNHSFHCKCEKCGKLFHIQCREILQLENHMLEQHGFHMDSVHTVFYGVCDQCR